MLLSKPIQSSFPGICVKSDAKWIHMPAQKGIRREMQRQWEYLPIDRPQAEVGSLLAFERRATEDG